MSYQALYRKWRPNTFDQVKGQDHIVTTLKNQIKMQRIGHAYLFCGTRGTGKTTVAKIFAKAVNCLHPVDGAPCNECEMCQGISNQTLMNVIEIDAASHNGVNDIRDIRQDVEYSPSEGKYRVYILDEAHTLSGDAFNALLKTLEEPPEHAIFILATTEIRKIPVTILSRCQRYDFKRITVDVIVDRLNELIEKENINIEEKAVRYIASAADGALRDALSLLDQCVSYYIDDTLTYDKVLDVLGAVDTTVLSRLIQSVMNCNVTEAIYIIEEVVIQGRELSQFVTDFIWYMRNLMLAKSSEDLDGILDVSSENLQVLQEESKQIEMETLIRYIRVFSQLSEQMKFSAQKRVLLEVAVVKLCKPAMEKNYDSILNRLQLIEKQLEQGYVPNQSPSNGSHSVAQAAEAETKTVSYPPAMSEDLKEIIQRWDEIKRDLNPSAVGMLSKVQVAEGQESELILGFADGLGAKYFSQEDHLKSIEDAIGQRMGKSVKVRCVVKSEEEKHNQMFFDPKLVDFSKIEFVNEDE